VKTVHSVPKVQVNALVRQAEIVHIAPITVRVGKIVRREKPHPDLRVHHALTVQTARGKASHRASAMRETKIDRSPHR